MSNQACSFDKTLLVSYLYEECGAEDRRLVEAHLAGCQECGEEIAAFRGVRTQLAEWAPPDEILGFRVVRQPEPARRWWWPLPVWAQAAAAILVAMAGAAATNLEVRVGGDGLVVRSGWSQPGSDATAASTSTAPRPASAETASAEPAAATVAALRAEMAALEQKLRQERSAPAAGAAAVATSAVAMPVDEQKLMTRVRPLLQDTEDRLRSEFGVRLASAVKEIDSRRRADFLQIRENFTELEGRTGIEVARTNSALQYLMRVSQSGGTVIR